MSAQSTDTTTACTLVFNGRPMVASFHMTYGLPLLSGWLLILTDSLSSDNSRNVQRSLSPTALAQTVRCFYFRWMQRGGLDFIAPYIAAM